MTERLSYNLIRRKALKECKYPESTPDRAIIRSSSSGVGYQTYYSPEWSTLISQEEFLRHMKQVCYHLTIDQRAMLLCVLQEEETGHGRRETLGLHHHEDRTHHHRSLGHGGLGDRIFTRVLHRRDTANCTHILFHLGSLGRPRSSQKVGFIIMITVLIYLLWTEPKFVDEHSSTAKKLFEYFLEVNKKEKTRSWAASHSLAWISVSQHSQAN